MKRPNILITMLFALVLVIPLVASTGCSGAVSNNSSVSQSPVDVIYRAKFAGETASGDLSLVVDLAVLNKGDLSFEVDPSDFNVQVDGYKYMPVESTLEAVNLETGDNISGKLTFVVPPEAATTRVGYTMVYSGNPGYLINWEKGPELTVELKTDQIEPEVKIRYITDFMWVAPPGIQYLEVDPPGASFLIVEMYISNQGYQSFDLSPDNFSVEVSSPVDSFTSNVEGLLIDWRDFDLQNNGKFIGTLAFSVPRGHSQSFYHWDYKFIYSGKRNYNIDWIKLTSSMSEPDPVVTDLEGMNLPDGGILHGTLGYAVPSELSEIEDPIYELMYDYDTDQNVQFADQPDLDIDVNRDAIRYPAIKVTYSTRLKRVGVRLYVIADVKIENRGYESFNTSPLHFDMEVSY